MACVQHKTTGRENTIPSNALLGEPLLDLSKFSKAKLSTWE